MDYSKNIPSHIQNRQTSFPETTMEVTCQNISGEKQEVFQATVMEDSLETFFQNVSFARNRVFVEPSKYSPLPVAFTRYTDLEDFLVFSVLTDTAARITLAHDIIESLHKAIPMQEIIRQHIATAFHEAIQNAVIHGNCEIHSSFEDVEDFEAHYQCFEERLSDKEYSQRRITIEIGINSEEMVIAVTDEGKGYFSHGQGPKEKLKPYGLGLDLIARYCSKYSFLPGGNTLVMWFDLHNTPYKTTLDYQRKILKESLKLSKILLVDDVQFNLMILGEILTTHGFTNFKTATNGREAMEITLQWQPDIVVLDLIMPEVNGFEYCKQLRSNPKLKDIPVIVQTALSIPEQRTKAFEEGATDFIMKPVDPDEMIARLLVHLERHKLFIDLAASRQRMAEELDDARMMQRVLMPTDEQLSKIRRAYRMHIDYHFQTSSELGGDFWGIRPLSPSKLAVYNVDFAGHGVTAALNTFRLHALMNEYLEDAEIPERYVTRLNASLAQLLASNQFATMFYAILDNSSHTLTYAAAASPKPIIIRHNTRRTEFVDSSGFPLGIQSTVPYIPRQVSLYPGDILCLYSDALIETESNKREFLTEDRLVQFLEHTASAMKELDGGHLFQTLITHFNTFYAMNLKDDLTINFFQHSGRPVA